MKVADVAFPATITEGGITAADGLLLESVTKTPPKGAALFSVTVPVEFAIPPITVVGSSDSEETETAPEVAAFMVYVYAICPLVPAPARNALT